MNYLFHLSQADGFHFDLAPPSLESEGFVHLSAPHQVLRTADRWYRHCPTLKLLVLREELLREKTRWEDSYGRGEEFPHLYGPIPIDSIHTVATIEQKNGRFEWPDTLTGLLSPLVSGKANRETAVIEPSRRFPNVRLPERCLLNFFPALNESLLQGRPHELLEGAGSVIGAHRIYLLEGLSLCSPGFGGPVAAAALEELIALGARKFLLCGGAGSLVDGQSLGSLVLVDRAWRDEGVSHHYLPASPTVSVNPDFLRALKDRLTTFGVKVRTGATWTTDALYRETPTRIAERRESGCLTVEMEVASLLSVANYREVELGALLYCGDDLSTDEWDFRNWTLELTVQEKMLELGLDLLAGA